MLEVLSGNLTDLRKARGFKSREAFAEAAGIPFPTYREIESGNSWPERKNLLLIAAALGVPETQFFRDPKDTSAKLELFEVVAALDELKAQALLPFAKHIAATAIGNSPLQSDSLKHDESKSSSGKSG